MYGFAKIVNWLLIAIALLLFIFLAYENPWGYIIIGVILAAAAPLDFVLAKRLLKDKTISIKASNRQFARRFMEKAIYWISIGLTFISHGIVQTVSASLDRPLEGWFTFIPVFVFIISWMIVGKFRFDPNKYDKEEAQKA